MELQEYLLYVTELEIKRLNSSKIRAVTAYWKQNTACISFYFDNEIIDEDIESASDICTYIIAHFPESLLEENYIQWDCSNPLPKEFLAYQK